VFKREQVIAGTDPRTAIHHWNVTVAETCLFKAFPQLLGCVEPAVICEVATKGKIDCSRDVAGLGVNRFVFAEVAVGVSRIDEYAIRVGSRDGSFVCVDQQPEGPRSDRMVYRSTVTGAGFKVTGPRIHTTVE
jgi:hypothetical protein